MSRRRGVGTGRRRDVETERRGDGERNRAYIVFQGPGGGGGDADTEDAGELYEDPETVERSARAAATAADAANCDYDSPGEEFYDVPEEYARARANAQETAADDHEEHELYAMPEKRESAAGTPGQPGLVVDELDDIYGKQKSMARRLRLVMGSLGEEPSFAEFDAAAAVTARDSVGSNEDEYIQVTANDAAELETPAKPWLSRRYGAPADTAGGAREVTISPDIDDHDDHDEDESGSEWESADDSWDDTDEEEGADPISPTSTAAPPPLPALPPPALDTPAAKHNKRHRRPRSRPRKTSRGKALNARNPPLSRSRPQSADPPPPPLPRSAPPAEQLSAAERNRQKRTQERADAQKRREVRRGAEQLSAAERNRQKRTQEREDAQKRREVRLAAKTSTQAPAPARPMASDDWTTAADSMYDVRTVPATKAVLDGPADAAAELAGLRKRPRPGGPASAMSVAGPIAPDLDLEGLEGMGEPASPADSANISNLLHAISRSQSGRLDSQRSSNGPIHACMLGTPHSAGILSFSLSDATDDSADSDFYNPGHSNSADGRVRDNQTSPAEFLLRDNEDTAATGLVVTTDYHTITNPPRQPLPLGQAPAATDPTAPPTPPRRRHVPLPPASDRPSAAEYVVKPAERRKQAPWRPQTVTPPPPPVISPSAQGVGIGHDYRVDAAKAKNTPHDYRAIAEAQTRLGTGYAAARALPVQIEQGSRQGLGWTHQDYYQGHLSRTEAKALIISMSPAPLPDGLFLLRSSSNSDGAVVSFVLGGQVRHSRVRNDNNSFCLGDDTTAFSSIEALVAAHELLKFPLKTESSGC